MAPFFKRIGDFISRVVNGIGNAVTGIGKSLASGDPFGFGHVGENIPTSFSLDHDLNVRGQIDVQVAGSIDVNVRIGGLVTAARLIREGMQSFDIFGGVLRRALGDLESIDRLKTFAAELKDILSGPSAGAYENDRYYFDIQFVNATAKYAEDKQHHTDGQVGCSLTVKVNGVPLLDSVRLFIGKYENATTPIREEREVVCSKLQADANNITLNVSRMLGGTDDDLNGSLLQVRLIRQTTNWKYTLLEWIYEGKVGRTAEFTGYVHIRSKPAQKETSDRAKPSIAALDKIITLPAIPALLPPDDMQKNAAAVPAALLPARLLESYKTLTDTTVELRNALDKLDDGKLNTVDARTPITATLTCHSGLARVKITKLDDDAEVEIVPDQVTIPEGCELAISVPFHKISKHRVRFEVESAKGASVVTAAVYSGFEWAKETIAVRTIEHAMGEKEAVYVVALDLV